MFVGAVDEKHMFFGNYKGIFSIVLLAICDANNYCFTFVDIAQFGSNNDSGVLANSSIRKQFGENRMKLSAGRHLLGCPYSPLHCLLADDEIFPLKS